MKTTSFLGLTIVLIFFLQGCFTTTSKYDAKVREANMLRNALSESKKKNNALSTEIDEIKKTVDALAEELSATKGQLEARQEESERLRVAVEEMQKRYDTTKISRETLISELLEKEKKYSSQIRELTEKNAQLENTAKTLDGELDGLKNRLQTAEDKNSELENVSSKVLLLEGRISRFKEEIADFLPLSGVRQKGSVALSNTYSSRFIQKEISFLFASIPFEAAIESNGKNLSKDFHEFLVKLLELCKEEKTCKLDIIATGRTYDGSMDILNSLKDKELTLLNALKSFRSTLNESADFIRRTGRVTIIDKIGEKDEDRVDINIYLVRDVPG